MASASPVAQSPFLRGVAVVVESTTTIFRGARGTDEINSAPLVAGDVLSCSYQIDGNCKVALKLPSGPRLFGRGVLP